MRRRFASSPEWRRCSSTGARILCTVHQQWGWRDRSLFHIFDFGCIIVGLCRCIYTCIAIAFSVGRSFSLEWEPTIATRGNRHSLHVLVVHRCVQRCGAYVQSYIGALIQLALSAAGAGSIEHATVRGVADPSTFESFALSHFLP